MSPHKNGHKHGRTTYFIEGEGIVSRRLPSPRREAAWGGAAAAFALAPPDAETTDPERAFRFTRMFPELAAGEFDDEKLIALAKSMEETAGPLAANSRIPAGFTYLGQFVDHDITFDRTEGIPSGQLQVEDILQGRSPSLDLDSVYGLGPEGSPELYEADGMTLRVGLTSGRPDFGFTDALPNDVPRAPVGGPQDRLAVIGDERNDENLAVSQTHVAFLKFHNKVLASLPAALGADRFEKARETVVHHYQSIVLHDFVGRVADRAVLDDVLANGRSVYRRAPVLVGDHPAMPVEFSGAVYRMGHSMIRNGYQWNVVFNSQGATVATLALLFVFSRVSGDLGGEPSVPTDWTVDWGRLYDFGERPGGTRHPQLNFARLIDTNLAPKLHDLPAFQAAEEEHLKFLSARNLLRGRLLGLPTGQSVAERVGATPLTPAEVASGPQGAAVANLGFAEQTPLWYYTLKEAEVGGGQHLGPMGSRVLVETFHALIEGSRHSILREPGWKPSLPSVDPNRFQMTDLLAFVDDINPLGD